jgi:metal-responsive CopG/Arc/MetJ family transcriptional regulator
MKTAISLPDDLYEAVERIVRRSNRPRSAVYADALRDYVARHSPDEVTEAYNKLIDELGSSLEGDMRFSIEAGRRVLKNTEW